jgi:hypothetical protein
MEKRIPPNAVQSVMMKPQKVEKTFIPSFRTSVVRSGIQSSQPVMDAGSRGCAATGIFVISTAGRNIKVKLFHHIKISRIRSK